MFVRYSVICLLVCGLIGVSASESVAQVGGISVAPTRVLLEGRNRSETVTIINSSSQEQTYRLVLENKRIDENGVPVTITSGEEGELFADEFIRYSPRQVTIPAGGSQSVRLLARRSADLADGEYRSHLLIQTVPQETGNSIESPLNEGELDVRLVPLYGVSIPVLYRKGELSVATSVEQVAFNKGVTPEGAAKNEAIVSVGREGEKSLYGDITLHVKNKSGEGETEIGRLNNVSVYTPYAVRKFSVPLGNVDLTNASEVRVKIVDRENNDAVVTDAVLPITVQ